MDDVRYRRLRFANGFRQPVLTNSKRLQEFLKQNLPRRGNNLVNGSHRTQPPSPPRLSRQSKGAIGHSPLCYIAPLSNHAASRVGCPAERASLAMCSQHPITAAFETAHVQYLREACRNHSRLGAPKMPANPSHETAYFSPCFRLIEVLLYARSMSSQNQPVCPPAIPWVINYRTYVRIFKPGILPQ